MCASRNVLLLAEPPGGLTTCLTTFCLSSKIWYNHVPALYRPGRVGAMFRRGCVSRSTRHRHGLLRLISSWSARLSDNDRCLPTMAVVKARENISTLTPARAKTAASEPQWVAYHP
nr:hypothetical protein CFP56_57059 [Quercus suber]